MNSRRTPDRASSDYRSKAAAHGRPTVVRDAQAWVAGLKGEVQSMLAAFRRQHAEDAGGAIDRISAQVSELRLGISELLPRLREARLQGGDQDLQDRRAYLANIAEWVDGVKSATGDLCDQFQDDRAQLMTDVGAAREALFEELTQWGDVLRNEVAELTESLSKNRSEAAQSEARKRRAFIEQLRDDVAALLASFHSGGSRARAATPVDRSARAVRPPFAGAAPAVSRPAATAAAEPTSTGTRESILKSLRERALSAAMRPSDDDRATMKTGRATNSRSSRNSSRRTPRQ